MFRSEESAVVKYKNEIPQGCVLCIVPDGFGRRAHGAVVLKTSGAWEKTGEKLVESSVSSVSSVRDRKKLCVLCLPR
jgi:hypothetical protein